MSSLAIWIGALLIAVGVGGYAGTGGTSFTALIPAFMGIPILLLGILGRRERLRRHAMHAAAVLAAIGFLGSARGFSPFFHFVMGEPVERPAAAMLQTVTALLCLLFVVFAVWSFVRARSAGRSPEQP